MSRTLLLLDQDPHPDGKTMNALAEQLNLNKKQVSNFFERERRKANIVIESRRKGGAGAGAGGGSNNSSSNGSVTGSGKASTSASASAKKASSGTSPSGSNGATKKQSATSASAPSLKRTGSGSANSAIDKPFSPSSSIAVALKQQRITDSSYSSASALLPAKRSTRGIVKKEAYYEAFEDDDEYDVADAEEEENHDAEGDEYRDEPSGDMEDGDDVHDPAESSQSHAEESEPLIVEQQQNPLVQKNKLEASLSRSGSNASRYTSRNARYASRSPLYASSAIQASVDNFRSASRSPSPRPLSAGSSYDQSASLAGLPYASKNLAPPDMHARYGSRSSSWEVEEAPSSGSSALKRKRGSALSESPTVLFLRNPFPAPLPLQDYIDLRTGHTSDRTSNQAGPEEGAWTYDDNNDFAAAAGRSSLLLNPYQPAMRKRARVWFSKPASEWDVADVSSESVHAGSSQETVKTKPNKPVAAADGVPAASIEVRVSRVSARREAKTRAEVVTSENEEDSSAEESEFGTDGGIKAKKKDNRPGAALRTNIACKELKQAFTSNPHPPADVLEALAARLGLGKKQVSNYFVRERKKAGYTIKVRHGLHRRRGPNKRKVDKPAVVVTQHDDEEPSDLSQTAQTTSHQSEDIDMAVDGAAEEEEEEEEEEESEDGASDLGTQLDDLAIDNDAYRNQPQSARDDVPDLSYDDQELALSVQNQGIVSSLMMASRSLESMTTTSRQDDDEELASPPFEAVHLPPTGSDGKTSTTPSEALLSYEGHALPTASALDYV